MGKLLHSRWADGLKRSSNPVGFWEYGAPKIHRLIIIFTIQIDIIRGYTVYHHFQAHPSWVKSSANLHLGEADRRHAWDLGDWKWLSCCRACRAYRLQGTTGFCLAPKVDTQWYTSLLFLLEIDSWFLLISPARGQKFHEHVKGQSWSTKVEQRKKPLEKTWKDNFERLMCIEFAVSCWFHVWTMRFLLLPQGRPTQSMVLDHYVSEDHVRLVVMDSTANAHDRWNIQSWLWPDPKRLV